MQAGAVHARPPSITQASAPRLAHAVQLARRITLAAPSCRRRGRRGDSRAVVQDPGHGLGEALLVLLHRARAMQVARVSRPPALGLRVPRPRMAPA